MKRKVTALLTALLLTLTLCVPTLAWTEYGAIYDETDALGSEELSDLGQYTLPQLTEALHLDLRVDIFTNEDVSEGTTAGDIATYVYKDSGYGWGEEKDGISLTLVMEPLADGSYTLAETDWCVYAMLSETRGDGQELSGLVYDAVEPYMTARAWDGTDMTVSAEALCQAVNAMAATAADYLSADFPTEAQQPETVQSGEAPELGSTGMNYVFDLRGMLSDGEREELEDRAEDIALRRSCGIYTLFVEDFTAYGYGDDPYTALYQIYHAEGLGVGEDRNGVIIMLSMKERDYAMFVYGEWAEYAFDRYGEKQLEDRFLDKFSGGDWYAGVSSYLAACDEFLTLAEAGKPVRSSPLPAIGIAVTVSCLIAFLVCMILKGQMKSVRKGVDANVYTTAGGGLKLTDSYDHYTHTTETRRKIESDSGGGGRSSGGTVSRSGGGGHGRSGKF